jgi:malonyl-CoA/methylmalonyl-CoA synthetase
MTNHLFDEISRRMPSPETVFLETSAERTLTYGRMLALSSRMAHVLRARGIAPGDRVAVQVEKSPEALMLYLACLRSGAVYLPLNTAYTLAEVEYFVSDAEPKVVVCDPRAAKGITEIARKHGAQAVLTLAADGTGSLTEAMQGASETFTNASRGPDDLAGILYTSGTTGRSKGAMLSHENLASNARTLVALWRFTKDDRLIHALPIFHTHGLFVATNVTLLAGSSLLFLPRFDADEVFRLMPRATALMGVPTFYVRLVEDKRLTAEATAHMRLFISGSAPLLAETHRAFSAATGKAILERYGMTETNMITSNPYEGARIAGTVGLALPGVSVRVADPDTGRVLGVNEVGMIEVKGPNVFGGYWRMPEKTRAEFRPDGFFITGDLGKIDAAGYVSIVGRGKDLVITGGYNVYPKEVESEIDALPGVIESAVIGVQHPDLGEGVTAVVVLAKGAVLDEAAVAKALETRLARFKQPRRVIFVDELPRNTMSKVQKSVLRETYRALYAPRPTEPAKA